MDSNEVAELRAAIAAAKDSDMKLGLVLELLLNALVKLDARLKTTGG